LQTTLRLLALSTFTSLVALACSADPSTTPAPGGGSGTGGLASGGSSSSGSGGGGTGGLPSAGTSGGGTGGTAGSIAGGTGGSAGASGGSAGTGGGSAGTSGSGGGGTVSGCDGVTALFCDDFEGQTSGQAPTGAFDVDSGIVVDTTKAFSGTQAVHLTGADEKYLTFTDQFPMNDYHGRVMVFIAEVPQQDFHWDIITSQSDGGTYWEIGGMYQNFILVVDPPDHGLTSDPVPGGEWFCLQWQFKYGGEGQPNTFVTKKNGVALPNGEFTGPDPDGETWDAGPWQNLKVGWVAYGGGGSAEIWYDDLAFGTQEIPCPSL